ncbi:MAG TPA: xanthine dehydrogenase family protein molybdopterin-binding subunit [Stellaceae bacterium]
MGQFGIGQSVRRKEDFRLLEGKGQYADDYHRPGEVHAYFVRSPHAHAKLGKIDMAAAKKAPGVLAVYTYADVKAANLGLIKCMAPIKNADGSAPFNPGRTLLASDRVRQVGEPVAMVVADTLAHAKDAAELIDVSYDPLPAVLDPVAAAKSGGTVLYDGRSDNVALDWGLGDPKPVEEAFAKAKRIVKTDIAINRVVIAPMEPRAVVGEFDKAADRYVVHLGTQGVHSVRGAIAGTLGVKPEQVQVVTNDVGGSFGMKGFGFPEHFLVPWAAKMVGKPVRWNSDRQEAFVTDTQGREQNVHVELALDENARFLAIRADVIANMGAYLSQFSLFIPTIAGSRLLTGAYAIPAGYTRVRCVFTNTNWVDAYRGAGRPEQAYVVERLVDTAARELGISPDELRRRNFVPRASMPWKTPVMATFDSGDFLANMELAIAQSDWKGFEARRAEAKKRGKLRGIGMSYYMEVTAAGAEAAEIRFEPNGNVFLGIGAGPSGQGHETAFPQVIEDKLGIPYDKIKLEFGDTDRVKSGTGTGGARSLLVAGTAMIDASQKIIAKGKKLAGHFLEASEQDIEFKDGNFTIAGTDRFINIMDLAKRTREASNLPDGMPATLDETGNCNNPNNTFPNGSHICELEIDEETGATDILRYTVVDDMGLVVNPMIVMGQIHGGLVQGIGQALMEDTVFDPKSGQLLAGSFQDYTMPRADNFPTFEITFNNVPCTTNIMGIKGAGEAGSVGSLASVMNAVIDALSPYNIRHIDMPATPLKIWRVLQAAKGKKAA